MKIALASPPFPKSIDDGLEWVAKLTQKAAEGNAEIICFPESYLPGMRGTEFPVEEHNPVKLQDARNEVCHLARKWGIHVILPMDWDHPDGILNVAFVISNKGEIVGCQTKNQIDPCEDRIFVAGNKRELFEVNGVTFGISICHEGFRYPETVRWAARRGASIVFHPYFSGKDSEGVKLTEWGGKNNPYNEKAMLCRALENNIYFASVNYAMNYQDGATSVISPTGDCIAWLDYGKADVLLVDIDCSKATRCLATRYNPELYE